MGKRLGINFGNAISVDGSADQKPVILLVNRSEVAGALREGLLDLSYGLQRRKFNTGEGSNYALSVTYLLMAHMNNQGGLTDFLRYHALMRVFNGNISLWLHILRNTSRDDSEDAQFLRWLQDRCAAEPNLLEQIRESVDACGLWPPAQR